MAREDGGEETLSLGRGRDPFPRKRGWEGEVVLTYDDARTGAVARARQLRRTSTDAEKRLWRALRTKLPAFKWRRQMPVGPYFADIACFSEKLVIELDGGQHSEAAVYDSRRTGYLNARGFRVLRFWNNDVLSNTDGVLQVVAAELSTSPSQACGLGPSLSHGRGEVAEY